MKVCAIVVTYNRLNLLKQTIQKLQCQTRALDKIIIVNNASNDGTKEYLDSLAQDSITVIHLDKNEGGAGGFYTGIKYAVEKKYDYLWIMDDDTFAMPRSLEGLLNGLDKLDKNKVGFVCSNVLFKDNKPCYMNVPSVSEVWNEFASEGLIKVDSASFVSILINRQAIEEVGLPIKEFFIWGDDLEYTTRISDKFECYMSSESVVCHYMNENKGIDIVNTEANRVGRYFYEYRNKLYISKKRGINSIWNYFVYVIRNIARVTIKKNDSKFKKISIILKGVLAGITFNPKLEKFE